MICACCKTMIRGQWTEVDGIALCSTCFLSWEFCAARTVAMKERKPDILGALQQFIGGKSCKHYIYQQRPETLPW